MIAIIVYAPDRTIDMPLRMEAEPATAAGRPHCHSAKAIGDAERDEREDADRRPRFDSPTNVAEDAKRGWGESAGTGDQTNRLAIDESKGETVALGRISTPPPPSAWPTRAGQLPKPGLRRAILDAVDLALLHGCEPGVCRWRLDPAPRAAA